MNFFGGEFFGLGFFGVIATVPEPTHTIRVTLRRDTVIPQARRDTVVPRYRRDIIIVGKGR